MQQAEGEERRLVARGFDHRRDGDDGQRRAGAEAGGGQSSGQSAAIGKPFQRRTDAGAVDGACADAADGGGDIKEEQRGRDRIEPPGDAAQDAADQDDDARSEFVDEPAFDRHQPGFHDHEDRERDLDLRPPPAMLLADRIDEQGPAILEIGHHRHADDADRQLQPAPADRTRRLHILGEHARPTPFRAGVLVVEAGR